MATDALRGAAVVFLQQSPAMRTVLELRQLVGGQRGIELVHESRVGMATGAELNDPFALGLAIAFRPFFDHSMPEISGRIAAVASGTGESATEMNVLHNFFQVHVSRWGRRT